MTVIVQRMFLRGYRILSNICIVHIILFWLQRIVKVSKTEQNEVSDEELTQDEITAFSEGKLY